MADQRGITLYPSRDSQNEVVWQLELSHNGGKGGPGAYPTLVLGQNLKKVKIDVTIKDASAVGVKFSNDPIWIDKMAACPTRPDDYQSPQSSGVYEDQIPKKDVVKSNDSQMSFVDLNKGDPMCLSYRLNFVDTKLNNKEIHLDPIVDNGGGVGGIVLPGWIAAGGFVAAVLLGLLIARFVLNWRPLR